MSLAFREAGRARDLELLLSSAPEFSPRPGKSKWLGHLLGKAEERSGALGRIQSLSLAWSWSMDSSHQWLRVPGLGSRTAATLGKALVAAGESSWPGLRICRPLPERPGCALAARAQAVLREEHLLTLNQTIQINSFTSAA